MKLPILLIRVVIISGCIAPVRRRPTMGCLGLKLGCVILDIFNANFRFFADPFNFIRPWLVVVKAIYHHYVAFRFLRLSGVEITT